MFSRRAPIQARLNNYRNDVQVELDTFDIIRLVRDGARWNGAPANPSTAVLCAGLAMVSCLIDHDRPTDGNGHLEIVHPDIVRYGDGDQGYIESDSWKYNPLSNDIHAFNVLHGLLYLSFRKAWQHHIIYFKITKNHSITIHDFSSCFQRTNDGDHDHTIVKIANYLLSRTWHGEVVSSSDQNSKIVGCYKLEHYDHGITNLEVGDAKAIPQSNHSVTNPELCGAKAFLHLVENCPNHGRSIDSLCDWLQDGTSAFDKEKHDEDYYTKMKCVRIVTKAIVRCRDLNHGNALVAKPSQFKAWLQRWPYLKASYMVKWTHFSEPEFQVLCICQEWAYKRNKVFLPCCGLRLHTNCFFRFHKDKEILNKHKGRDMKCFSCQQPMTTIHLLPDKEHTFTNNTGYFQRTVFPHLGDGGTLAISSTQTATYSQLNIDHACDAVQKMSPTEHVSMRRMILGAQLLLMDYPKDEVQTMLLVDDNSGYNIRRWTPSRLLENFHIDFVPSRSDLNFFISNACTTFVGVDGVQCILRDDQANESEFDVSDDVAQFDGDIDNDIEVLGTVNLKHWIPLSVKCLHTYAFGLLDANTKWFTVLDYPHEIDRYDDKTYFNSRKEVLIFRFGQFIFLTFEDNIEKALRYLPLVCALPKFPTHKLKCVKGCEKSFPFSPEWCWHHNHGPGCCVASQVRLGNRVPIGNQIGFFLHQSVLRCFEKTITSVKGWTPQRLINPNAVPPIYARISTNQLRLENKWVKSHDDHFYHSTIMDYYSKKHVAKEKERDASLLTRRPHFSGQYEFEDFSFMFDFNNLPTEVKHGMMSLSEDPVYLPDNLNHLNQKRKKNNSSETSSLGDRKPAAKRR